MTTTPARGTRTPACALAFALALTLAAFAALLSSAPAAAQIGEPVDSVGVADSADPGAATGGDTGAGADHTGPRPLRPDDYGQWESLNAATLSPDGSWLAVGVGRVNEDAELRIHRVGADSVVVVPFGSRPAFSSDGRWLAYAIGYSDEERERLTARKQTAESRLGILDLAGGDTTLVTGVSAFSFSDDGRYLAMRRHGPASADADDPVGADLVVRDLRTGVDTNFGNVGEFAWQDARAVLAMTVSAAGKAGHGVRLWDPASGVIRMLDSEPAAYRELRWRENAPDLLVLRAFEGEDRDDASHAVLVWHDVHRRTRARTFDPREHPDFPADTRVVELRAPEFSDDGRAIFFGVKEWPLTAAAAEDGPADGEPANGATGGDAEEKAEEKAGVEVWHSRDVDIIPRQKMTATSDRRQNHLAVWHTDDGRFARLGSHPAETLTRVRGDRMAVAADPTPHDRDRMFGPQYADISLVDTRTGERRKVLERIEHFFGPSPEGRYLLYLEDDHFRVYDIRDDRRINLTERVPTIFVDTADDHTVQQKPPFRPAGWTRGDRSVVLHDAYDAWEIRPDGSGGRRLTGGAADSVVHRYNRVGWTDDQRAIDPAAPAYWNLTGQWTKRNGYAVSPRLDRTPERRIWRDASVTRLTRARDADVFAYVTGSFTESPDYFVARGRLDAGTRVTRTNRFQDDFAWGRSELIDFHNTRGQRLQGALFYPADYEPGRRYPMITYIYEIRSPTVHRYYVPSERSAYNPAVWTSRGYFVFQPDIVYRARNPGVSALEALVPAVEAVLETGMVDPGRVGLIGHSWGGYQTAFVPTQTDMFAAAVAGAPLTELTSMYLSIYWNFGGTDARIFEISQGRMEVPPWEDFDSYNANSPVHHIASLNTPMLVAFGDQDGAVDWNQGIVFYNAARRAGKDMLLLVYEGENHGLRKEANQIDYHRRINQWFDHYLKGEPAPAWMSTGVPYLRQQEGEAAPNG